MHFGFAPRQALAGRRPTGMHRVYTQQERCLVICVLSVRNADELVVLTIYFYRSFPKSERLNCAIFSEDEEPPST